MPFFCFAVYLGSHTHSHSTLTHSLNSLIHNKNRLMFCKFLDAIVYFFSLSLIVSFLLLLLFILFACYELRFSMLRKIETVPLASALS